MALNGVLTGEIISIKDMHTRRMQRVLHMIVDATPYVTKDGVTTPKNGAEVTHLHLSIWDKDAQQWGDLLEEGDTLTAEGVFARKRYTRRKDNRQVISFVFDDAKILGFTPAEQAMEDSE